MKSRDWLNRNKKDLYVKAAKERGYLSRATFKLLEIENKFNLIIKANNILEFGSSPGGWTQFILEKNPKSKICAIDLIDMKFHHKNIEFIKKDFRTLNFKKMKNKFDLILSDIAPNTTGHQSTDHLRISTMINEIILILDMTALPKSSFVFKLWKGSEEKNIIRYLKKIYEKISYFKPHSSRNESSEIFIVAQKYIG